MTPTQPGYAEFEVAPALGGLEHFEGRVPVNNGSVRVKLDAKTVEIETDAPGGYYVRDGARAALKTGEVNRFAV